MPIRYTAEDLIKMIKKDGWTLDRVKGSHHIYVHPVKTGTVVIPVHRGTLAMGTANSILKQAGLK